MAGKFSVFRIVSDHVRTLYIHGAEKLSWLDLLKSFGVPFIISATLIVFDVRLRADLVSVLATSLSVFVALLFNLLILIYDLLKKEEDIENSNRMIDKEGQDSIRQTLRRRVLREVYANISFSNLISIVALAFLLIGALGLPMPYLNGLISSVVFFLIGVFIVTVFMILKRIHALLSTVFEQPRN